MENADSRQENPGPETAAEYQRLYGRRMMVLKKRRGATAEANELCRITSVNTIAPDLWVTVQFLDGSARSFRTDMIEPAAHDHPADS
jgi:hypothetical protein